MSKHKEISKFLSLVLRHKPETIGINLDSNGWVDVDELISKIQKGINKEILEEIVLTNDKQRFAFNEDKTKIRANQGHSLNIDLDLKESTPPDMLYHGTAERFIKSIMETGIRKNSRTHIHLSESLETAVSVGNRYGKPVLLKVDTKRMFTDGYKFYVSENNVWLTESVPTKYIVKE